MVISWDPTVRWSMASWPSKIKLRHCTKKKFLKITFCSENEHHIFLLINLSTSVRGWNSIILFIFLILAGIKIHMFLWSQAGFQDLGDALEIFFQLVKGNLHESLLSALVPGAACAGHISLFQPRGLPLGSQRCSWPPAVSASLDLRKLPAYSQLPPFCAAHASQPLRNASWIFNL